MLVSGCFDILHVGHLRFLKEAKSQADILIVGVLSDSFVKQRKGMGRPIFSENNRLEILSGLAIVNFVLLISNKDTEFLVKNLKPDYYGVGGDRKGKILPEKYFLDQYGVEIKYFSQFVTDSTSKIIRNSCKNRSISA